MEALLSRFLLESLMSVKKLYFVEDSKNSNLVRVISNKVVEMGKGVVTLVLSRLSKFKSGILGFNQIYTKISSLLYSIERNSMKAQSGIEYLMTYGWALIGLGVITGGIYSISGSSCAVQSDVFHPEIRIEDQAFNSNNELNLAIRSASNDIITINKVRVGGEGGVEQSQYLTLEPGETRAYEVAKGEEIEGCAESEITVFYDIGVVRNQRFTGTIQMPYRLIDAVVNLLDVGGGEIQELQVNSTIKPNFGPLCIGDDCDQSTSQTGNYVSRSTDTMTGPLITERLEFECMGDQCTDETGSLPGNVSNINNTMDGTLKLSDISYNQRLTVTQPE